MESGSLSKIGIEEERRADQKREVKRVCLSIYVLLYFFFPLFNVLNFGWLLYVCMYMLDSQVTRGGQVMLSFRPLGMYTNVSNMLQCACVYLHFVTENKL